MSEPTRIESRVVRWKVGLETRIGIKRGVIDECALQDGSCVSSSFGRIERLFVKVSRQVRIVS